jgi:hypothetical protein
MTAMYAGLARWDYQTASTPVPLMKVRKTNLPLWCFGAAARIAMAREAVPSAYHHTETLFRYLRMRTPKVLIVLASGLFWVSTD